MMVSLSIQTGRTPITHSLTHSILTWRFGASSHDSWMSPRVLSPRRATRRARTRRRVCTTFTMHGLTMTSAVVGTTMTTRATSSSSRVSRGALTIVNSGAGPKRVRRATNERGRTGERPNARADARGLPVVVATAIARERRSRERRRGTMGGWMRGNKNYVSRSSRRRRGCARGDVDGRCGRRIDRAIATAPRIRARGGEG